MSIAKRFATKIRVADIHPLLGTRCWEWIGCVHKSGYGSFKFGGKCCRAHRVAWILTRGNPTHLICHYCDNPLCVRPSHLFEGTDKDNSDDRDTKGRLRVNPTRGEQRYNAVLTEEAVKYIRTAGLPAYYFAEYYGVNEATIRKVLKRRSWKHVL
jgi:HNH endonuclease